MEDFSDKKVYQNEFLNSFDKYIKEKQQKREKTDYKRSKFVSTNLEDIKDVKIRIFLPIKSCKNG